MGFPRFPFAAIVTPTVVRVDRIRRGEGNLSGFTKGMGPGEFYPRQDRQAEEAVNGCQ